MLIDRPLLADDGGGSATLIWIAFFLFRFLAWATATSTRRDGAAEEPAPPPDAPALSRVEGGYAIPCPLCGQRDIQEARRVEVLHGRGLWPTVEWHVVAGCTPCVKKAGVEMLRLNLHNGFKTFAGALVTPLALTLGAWRVYGSPSVKLADDTIRASGVEPDDVRLNHHGVTWPQQRLVNAAAPLFALVIWADGDLAVRAHQRAARAMRRLTNERLPPDHATELLRSARLDLPDLHRAGRAFRGTLFRMLREVAIAEGQLSRRRLAAVYRAAQLLGYSERDVDALLGSFAHARPDPESDARGRGSRRDHRDRSPPVMGDLALARRILGVDAMATYAEIQAAYRVLIARHHPDRAGSDPRVQEERTRKTQELTWAMGVLRRAAYRSVS